MNKKAERQYFLRFKDHYLLPSGSINEDDRESPDFILTAKNGLKIGIELTRLYRNEDGQNSEQVQSEIRQAIIAKALEIYKKTNSHLLNFHFGFDAQKPFTQSRQKCIDIYAPRLTKLASKIQQQAQRRGCSEAKSIIYRKKFIPNLFSVHFNPLKYDDVIWNDNMVHSPKLVDKVQLQAVLDKKNERLRGYEVCDAHWLLIVIEYMDLALGQELPEPEILEGLNSDFDKVIIFRTAFNDFIEKDF